MHKPFTTNFKKGLLIAIYEYLSVITPIGIYTSLEAIHKNQWKFFFSSPEWSIATIFLSFVSLFRFISSIGKTGKKAIEPAIGIIAMLSLILIIAATLNAKISMEQESTSATLTRMSLFAISTATFYVFVIGSSLLENSEG